MQSMGVILYSKKPGNGSGWPVCKPNNGGDPGGVAWADRFNWYPMTIRVTVVAVSIGSTFSGWDKYIINPSLRQPKPNYGIDFINETTDKAVPSTDQFSIYSGMSHAVDGAGDKMLITPGQDHNFRTKAGSGLLVSETQHFRAPVRPATPTFILDKVNHRTTTAVSGDYEYSSNADMSGAITGSGTTVSIPAGTTMYFRKKATPTSFKSKVQALDENSRLPIPHELLVFNDTIDFPNNTDTNGFYYFYYNADMPVDWKSPEDYYYGEIFTRYEIISEKTEEPVGLQVGFWQMLPPETGELHETMSPMGIMNGTGSVVTTQSSPYLWWKLTGGFDYTRMDLTWHMGINPWKVDPVYGDNKQIRQENASVWAERFAKWFPMKVRVTVVAVGAYQTFSGWDNYISTNPGAKKTKPNIGVDYINEQTNVVIPSTVEYSSNAGMSGAVNGIGQKLALTPGKDVYFRTKAGEGLNASDIQHLVVPARPAGPTFSIDWANEKTVQTVTTDIEYANSDQFASFSPGTGNRITVVPGQDLYFRKKASASAFRSEQYHLVSPARPAGPLVTIDYLNERTRETIVPGIEYSQSSDLENAIAGNNNTLNVTPGINLYFRAKASSSAYMSLVSMLNVPERPALPAITIDYFSETTSFVAPNLEWSVSTSMYPVNQGLGSSLNVTPGIDLYFRIKASSGQFKSDIQHLPVPVRPPAPLFTIDYVHKATAETADANMVYATQADLSDPSSGSGGQIALIPGQDLYFKQLATNSSFKTDISHLTVPSTNFLGYSGTDTVTTDKVSMYVLLVDPSYVFTLNNLQVTNATVRNLRSGNAFDVYPVAEGPVSVVIPANAVADNTFASNPVEFYYDVSTDIGENNNKDFSIYPNPSRDGVLFIHSVGKKPYSIEIYAVDGHFVRKVMFHDITSGQIDLHDLKKGLYFLRIHSEDTTGMYKVILE